MRFLLALFVAVFALAGCSDSGNSASSRDRDRTTTTRERATTPKHTTTPTTSTTQAPSIVVKSYSYGPASRHKIDVCYPSAPLVERPAVLMIHGGSWTKGDKSYFINDCKALAKRGFFAATMNYRLVPGTRHPGQVDDTLLALNWLKARVGYVDPSRVCTWGVSAGGFLSAWMGVEGEVKCAVLQSAPVDLTARNSVNNPLYNALLNGYNSNNASPLFSVTSSSSPMLLAHGTSDPVVQYSTIVALRDALTTAGVSVVFTPYSGQHIWTGTSSSTKSAVVNAIYSYLTTQLSP
jgi:acetyl esterase